jgi:hypothetical protein
VSRRYVSVSNKIRDLEPRSGHPVHRIIGRTVYARVLNVAWEDLYLILDLACVRQVTGCTYDLCAPTEDDETAAEFLNVSSEVMWNIQAIVGRVVYKYVMMRIEDHITVALHNSAARNTRRQVWQQLLESCNDC